MLIAAVMIVLTVFPSSVIEADAADLYVDRKADVVFVIDAAAFLVN